VEAAQCPFHQDLEEDEARHHRHAHQERVTLLRHCPRQRGYPTRFSGPASYLWETRENYCTEYIKFEVSDFKTSYHAILGRPAIAKFMAVPHYTCLVLKMPSPAEVVSLQGDLKISFDRDTEAVELATTNQVPNVMMEIFAASKKLTPTELEIPEKTDTANKPQPSEEVQVKAIDLGTGDSSKTTMIGVGLDPK
jgi:hypothetical protein